MIISTTSSTAVRSLVSVEDDGGEYSEDDGMECDDFDERCTSHNCHGCGRTDVDCNDDAD